MKSIKQTCAYTIIRHMGRRRRGERRERGGEIQNGHRKTGEKQNLLEWALDKTKRFSESTRRVVVSRHGQKQSEQGAKKWRRNGNAKKMLKKRNEIKWFAKVNSTMKRH